MLEIRARDMAGAVAMLLALLTGCGGHKQVFNVTATPGQKATVEMKASSFHFDPAVITAHAGDTLILHVTNVSGEKHNITVKNPAGAVIADQDIPGHQAVTVEVALPTAGVYPFYCDVDLHTTLGMKGKIEVE